jgi:pilus assembly protein CpaE
MNEKAVAFAFNSVPQKAEGRELKAEQLREQTTATGGLIIYTSAEECRNQMRSWESSVSVIINDHTGDISPVNLAAALCADNPERDVYLLMDAPTQSLANNARAAGVRGIVNISQVEHLLATCMDGATFKRFAADNDLSLPSLAKSASAYVKPVPAYASPPIQVIRQETKSTGRVIGFLSGRGGVGKSTIALMTALSAQQRGVRTALVDLDLQFGDLGFLAGREPTSRIQRISLQQACGNTLPELSDEALALVLAPDQPEQGESFSSGVVPLLDELAARKDLVVVNTGSFWTDVHAKTIQRCTQIALLMDQRATSIEACKQVVDLCYRLQVPQANFIHLLNGCGRGAAFTPQDASLALGGFEVLGIADGGALVDELLSLGCPMELLGSGNALMSSLEGMLDKLIGVVPAKATQGASEHTPLRKAKIFDIGMLRRFFEGGQRVAP